MNIPITHRENQSITLGMFLHICHIVAELSSPPPLTDVRRTMYEFVQAVEEAQKRRKKGATLTPIIDKVLLTKSSSCRGS